MKKTIPQIIVNMIRNATPLSIRQIIGPHIAKTLYSYRMHLNYKRPKVLSINETLSVIIEKKLSVIRFGDGEITLLDEHDLSFQKKNKELAKLLEEIIQNKADGLLICIPGIWGDISVFEPYAQSFIIHHLYRQAHIWKRVLSYKYVYGDAYITRHYLGFINKIDAGETFKKFFSIWDNKNVVLIEGSKSRIGVGNDIFSNTKSVERILCPAEDAFSMYDAILAEAKKIDKNKLVLIALGPTAKVLAYDLFLLGYRVIDIGHIDMEYDMFIRKEIKQVKIPYKYFNEINERNPEDCTDSTYVGQIIKTIL